MNWEVKNRASFFNKKDAESYCLENRIPFSSIFEITEDGLSNISSIRNSHSNFSVPNNPLAIKLVRDDFSSRIRIDDNKEGTPGN